MADLRVHAEVLAWGERVGAVAELDSGRILFEYDPAFARRGIELSPLLLPTSLVGPVAFDELARSPAFNGLPGLLADALPDAFGNKVIRAWFAARGREAEALSPVQRLLYVGDRALGALSFRPATPLPARLAEQESLDLAELVRDARGIVEGRSEVAIPEIYRIGSSAGGMRPKAVVLHDATRGLLKSAYASRGPDDRPAILKFDGVGDGTGNEALGAPLPFNRIEAAYNDMARAAGLGTAELEVLEQGDHAHLLIYRFDLDGDERVHQHSFGGMTHVDYNVPGASSYEEYLRCILSLGMAGAAIEEGFRRAAFNVMAVNQDDHVKNLSFLLPRGGSWMLSPAYDLTFARGQGFTRRHQMRLADKTAGIRDRDLLDLATTFGIKRASRILDEVRAAVRRFPEFAAARRVPAPSLALVEEELRTREAEMVST
ncbi:MAG: type II toxin-antitoxin system HipA family toxin [Planctomycetes bacterium]|nr:type II toxin-antitoxin system HipA family toxin [Planctomycetota bacterium]